MREADAFKVKGSAGFLSCCHRGQRRRRRSSLCQGWY